LKSVSVDTAAACFAGHFHQQEFTLQKKSLIPIAVFCLQFGTPFVASAEPLTENQAVSLALKENQGVAAMDARAEAFRQIPDQAGALPDPELSLGAVNLPVDSFSTTAENMTQIQLGLSQKFPFPGKRGLSEQAAGFEADSARFESSEIRLRTERDVRISWWNLAYLDRSLEVVERNKSLLRQFIRIAETKYKTGQGIQSDILLAQVELSRLLDREIGLKGKRQSEQANLNALLNRSPGTQIVLPSKLDESLPPLQAEELLLTAALNTRPLLGAQQGRVHAAESRSELAEMGYYPDFSLSGTYGWRNGLNPATGRSRPDMASIRLGITLPLYAGDKQSLAVQQKKAETAKEQFALNDLTRAVQGEVYRARADYIASRDKALLFRTGLIPQANQTVASMLASYQVNKVDFLSLVQAQVTLYNYETEYWKAISDGQKARARLEAAVGRNITRESIHE